MITHRMFVKVAKMSLSRYTRLAELSEPELCHALYLAQQNPLEFDTKYPMVDELQTSSGNIASVELGDETHLITHWDTLVTLMRDMGGLCLVAGSEGGGKVSTAVSLAQALSRGDGEWQVLEFEKRGLITHDSALAKGMCVTGIVSASGASDALELVRSGCTVIAPIEACSAQAAFNRLREWGVSESELREGLTAIVAMRDIFWKFEEVHRLGERHSGERVFPRTVVSELASFESSGDFARFEAGQGPYRTMRDDLAYKISKGSRYPGKDGDVRFEPDSVNYLKALLSFF